MKKIWLIALLSPVTTLADSAVKNNRIYEVSVNAEWQYHRPKEKSQFDYTTGEVELTIQNKTIIPLTFGGVKVRHHCQQLPEWSPPHNPKYSERDYRLDFKEAYLGRVKVGRSLKIFTKEDSGPCGGGYGGVVRSEIIAVEFAQHKMISFDQHMQCGDERVPVVWAISPNLKRYIVYTDKGMIVRNFDTIKGRDGSTLPLMEKHTQILLQKDICGNRLPDQASKNRWRVNMINHIKKWVDACSRDDIREKCKKTYEKIYKGWSEGSSGVRG